MLPKTAKEAADLRFADHDPKDEKKLELSIKCELTVAGAVLEDHGDHDAWRLSRLRWLDSTIGQDNDNSVTKPYIPLQRQGKTIKLLGRDLTLGESELA